MNVFANLAYSKIVSLGGAPPLKTGGSARYRNYLLEGYAGSYFGAVLAVAIPLNIPTPVDGVCQVPTTEQALSTSRSAAQVRSSLSRLGTAISIRRMVACHRITVARVCADAHG